MNSKYYLCRVRLVSSGSIYEKSLREASSSPCLERCLPNTWSWLCPHPCWHLLPGPALAAPRRTKLSPTARLHLQGIDFGLNLSTLLPPRTPGRPASIRLLLLPAASRSPVTHSPIRHWQYAAQHSASKKLVLGCSQLV